MIKRKAWSKKELDLVTLHFKEYIKSETYPSGCCIKNFISETKIKRTIPVIKSKIQHLITIKNK